MTSGERSARINREFDRSFGVFDGRMRDEQSVIAGQRGGRGGNGNGNGSGANGANGEGAGGSESGSGSGEKGQGAGGQGQGQGQGQGGSGTGSRSGQGQGGNGATGGGGVGGGGPKGGGGPNTVPANIPDGSDDDVVARQLREAATNESDPELREKLWQEYRNYKKGG